MQFDTSNLSGDERQAAERLVLEPQKWVVGNDVDLMGPHPNRPIMLARTPGSEPLRPLVLNRQMDLTPADASQWTHAPFRASWSPGDRLALWSSLWSLASWSVIPCEPCSGPCPEPRCCHSFCYRAGLARSNTLWHRPWGR